MDTQTGEMVVYWGGLIATLEQKEFEGLIQELRNDASIEYAENP